MSGHSKWANIKHRKAKSDSSKGKIFTKIGREISLAVREGGPDPEANTRLKDVIANAKAANMPSDSIVRSIKKAAGEGNVSEYVEISYEGYGPEGVAVIVNAMTDNKNRTAGEIRHFFDKFGGNLGTTGCVSFMFNKKGVIMIEKTDTTDEDKLMMEAIDLGTEDFNSYEEYLEILTAPSDYPSVRGGLEKRKYEFISSGIEMVPLTMTKITDPKNIELMEKLIENLDDLDDVQSVYHNWEQE